jgi:GNAT superfamily N-acetyltransferase
VDQPESAVVSLASISDVPELVALLGVLFKQESDFVPQPERQKRAIEEILSSPWRGCILVARRRGPCVGMVSLLETISSAEGGVAVWLEDLVISPDVRGQGVGSALVNAAFLACQSRGITRITLLTDNDNTGARRFYARHGFVASAMTPLRRYLPLMPPA